MITIPVQLYAGLKNQGKDESRLPLAFVTPFDDTPAFAKRLSTINRWVEGYYGNKKSTEPTPLNFPNEPVDGFKIADSIRRYGWGKGNVVWRMVDPRGFEFEISSPNLASILDCTTIENGVIKGACVYGRDGAQNSLLPVSSQPYLDAQKNTVRAGKKVSIKDVKAGDMVLLKDGREVHYLGYHNVATQSTEYIEGNIDGSPSNYYRRQREHTEHKLVVMKKRHLIGEKLVEGMKDYWSAKVDDVRDGATVVRGYSELHVSEITKDGVRTRVNLLDRKIYLSPDNGYTVVPKGSTLVAEKSMFFSYGRFVELILADLSENRYGPKHTYFVGIGNQDYVLGSRYNYSNGANRPQTEADLYEPADSRTSPNGMIFSLNKLVRDVANNTYVTDTYGSSNAPTRATIMSGRFQILQYLLDGNVLTGV